MDVTAIICVSEILGSVYLYRLAPVVIALAIIGLAAIWAARRSTWSRSEDPAPIPQPAQPSEPRTANAVAIVAVSVVVAEWSTQIVAAYHHGMLSTDTLWYHMPFAARFVQDHSITGLHYFDSQGVTVFFPASSELFHSLGILLMGNDVLSPLLNTLWLGLALLASWCIGRPFGVAPVTLTGSAILFATPGLVATQPGGAYDDVFGLALILSAVALLINSQGLSSRSQPAAWVIAAASVGLALGTKWTFIGPAAALTVGVSFLVARGERIRRMVVWLVVLLLTGGFWYGRNFIAVGNPVPPLHLKLGPLSLPSPQLTTLSGTVAHFLFDAADWHQYFLPGLRLSLWAGLVGAPRSLRFGPCACDRQRGSAATDPRCGRSRVGSLLPLHASVCGARPICREPTIRRSGRDPGSRPAADQSGALDVAASPMGPACLYGGSRRHPIRCWDLAHHFLQRKIRRRPRAGL